MDRDQPLLRGIAKTLMLLIGVYDLLFLGGFFDYAGIFFSIITHRGVNLLFFIVLTYLIMPAHKKSSRFTWYDLILLLAGLIPALYVTAWPDRVMAVTDDTDLVTAMEMAFFLALVVSIMEAGRRSAGLGLLAFCMFFFSALFFGDYYPGPFYARTLSLKTITACMYLCLGENSIFGLIADIGSTIIVAFMLFSGFLQVSGAGDFFIKLGLSVAGRFRGGPAKVAILASALMGTISGSGVANVVTTGTLTIPLMKRAGYEPHFAGAVEAVASNGGQIMPPVMGAVAFIMAQMLGISYWQVCLAAFVPASIYYTALFFMIDFEAVRLGLKGLPREEIPLLRQTLKEGWYFLIPILVLVVLISQQTYSVHKACILAIGSLGVLSFLQRRDRWFTPRRVTDAITTGVKAMVFIAGALYSSGIIIASIQMAGLGINFTRLIAQFAGESVLLMLSLAALSSFILGIGMSSIPCYIICVLLVGPPLIEAGVLPIAAHLFFFYWGILSFITPPVAECALVASGIAGASFWKTGFTAMRLGIVSYFVPFFFIYQPALLLKGSLPELLQAVGTSLLGCYILASGVIGQLLGGVNWMLRIVLVIGGLLMIYPGWRTDLAGLAVFLIIGFWQWTRKGR